MLISQRVHFGVRNVIRNRDYIKIKESIVQLDIVILDLHVTEYQIM